MTARKVMIVEDEMIVQLHLEQIVKDMGHEVTATAATGRKALEEASRLTPELVLMDINLPGGMDGVSAARELRERYGCAVVFATAHADDQTLERSEAVEASGYIVKPFTSTEVRAAVRTALAKLRSDASAAAGPRTTPHPAASDTATASRPFGAGTRMLVYSHDTFGMGHLQRSLKLIRAVMKRNPEVSLLLVTGSPVAHRYDLPERADYVKLPAVRKVGSNQYASRTRLMSGDDVRKLRANILLHVMRDFDPNVLLVDHSPSGMQGELLPSLEWLSGRGRCRRILGLRDVTDDAANVRERWRKEGIYSLLEHHYDEIAVYGDCRVYDPVREYGLPEAMASATHFLGYVCDREPVEPAEERAPADKPRIAVSIGGGDGAASLILAYLSMLRRYAGELDVHSEILTGPLVDAEELRQIREQADGLPVQIHEFMPSTTRLFAEADLVISTAGYNTVTQLLAHAKRALLVPRVLHRREQIVRSRRLEALGLVHCLHPEDCKPERLYETIREALSGAEHPLEEARKRNLLPLDGAERFAEFCSQLVVDASLAEASDED